MTDMDADKQDPTTDTAPMTGNDQQLASHMPSTESVENATAVATVAAEEAGKYIGVLVSSRYLSLVRDVCG